MARPRIKRSQKVAIEAVLTVNKPKEEYKKPDTLCKVTIANIRETRAKATARKLMGLICDQFGITFDYQY